MSIIELERTLWAIADKLRANKDIDEQHLEVVIPKPRKL